MQDRNPERIYRGLEEVTYRRMLEDDGQGRRHFEVGHKAIAHFFCISFHIETCSLVWEDDNEKVVRSLGMLFGYTQQLLGSSPDCL